MNDNASKPCIDIETNRLSIRNVVEADKEAYMSVRRNNSVISCAYKLPGFEDYEWNWELNSPDSIYLSVFIKSTNTLVASASVQKYLGQEIELGYDVVDSYRSQGIATEVVKAILAEVHRLFPEAKVIVRIDKNNTASRRVAEKCGGVLTKSEDTFMTVVASLVKEMNDKGTLKPEDNTMYGIVEDYKEHGKDSIYLYVMP